MVVYFAALDPMTLVRALPGNVAQGIIWGIMALGVYITFRILDFADCQWMVHWRPAGQLRLC